jgi:hypothetical protein
LLAIADKPEEVGLELLEVLGLVAALFDDAIDALPAKTGLE